MCRHTGRVTALAQLHKIEMQTQEELEQCRKEEADPLESMGPEELLAFIRNIVIELPPVLQDLHADRLDRRPPGATNTATFTRCCARRHKTTIRL